MHIIIYASGSVIPIFKKLFNETIAKEKRLNVYKFSNYAVKYDKGLSVDHKHISEVTNYLIKYFKNNGFSNIDEETKNRQLAHSHLYKYRRVGFFLA